MPYVIGDGANYVYQSVSGAVIVSDVTLAKVWRSKDKANHALKNFKHQFKGYNWRMIPVDTDNDDSINSYVDDVDNHNDAENLGFDILEKADEILELARQAERRAVYLNEQIRQTDLSIVDIEHAAEFYNLNAAQGYKLYKMLHDARVRRRKLKNELEKIHYFMKSSISSSSMENLKKSISGMEHRKYTPRVINELFGV